MNIRTSENKLIITEEPVESGYIFVYLLQHYMTSDTINYISTRRDMDTIAIDIPSDGFYTLYRFKLPLSENQGFYYNDDIFKNGKKIKIEKIIGDSDVPQEQVSYFFSNRIKQCFIDIYNETLKSCDRCEAGNNLTTYKRDLLSSTLFALNYLTEVGKFEEAQQILERVSGCNGLCSDKNLNNCGCR